jgi:Na+-translocating ferredoxin:NAD+ oxidoreductase RnfA subunit
MYPRRQIKILNHISGNARVPQNNYKINKWLLFLDEIQLRKFSNILLLAVILRFCGSTLKHGDDPYKILGFHEPLLKKKSVGHIGISLGKVIPIFSKQKNLNVFGFV